MSPAQFIDDPAWADFLPERNEAPRVRAVPTHEDCSRLDPEATAFHLRRGGTLGTMASYEERPGQLDMLEAIVRAFNAKEHLMIEAGTGVGKSLAYLVPAILWAHLNDTPVVIATATRNLQSQLMNSDIPKALAVLGDEATKFKVALLKGRANYLCLRQVSEFFAAGYWTMAEDEQAEMPHFIEWLHATPDGDLDNYEGLPRSLLSCPGEECSGRHCPFYSRCFVYQARKRAAEANLVIANHALVLAESVGGGVLPPYGRLILDEAHNLEDTATEYLSHEFSIPALMRLMNRLMRAGRGRRTRSSGILASVERGLQKGAYLIAAPQISRILGEILSSRARVLDAADTLAEQAKLMLKPFVKETKVLRYHVINGRRQHCLHGLFEDFDGKFVNERNIASAQANLENALASLVNKLHSLASVLEEEENENPSAGAADLMVQLTGIAESFVGFQNDTHFVLSGAETTHAYWAEVVIPQNNEKLKYVRLVGAPLSVASELRKLLYETKDSVILSSATLRVGGKFNYMSKRLGFCDPPPTEDEPQQQPSGRYRALTAESPFDYLRQALVLAPDCLPEPTKSSDYAAALARTLIPVCKITKGRALVLFTSYEMMTAVAQHARAPLVAAGLELLVQGEGLSREAMTLRLKSATEQGKSIVLFGAQSFWEGVDVAGEALSCVVLTRLPFAQRGDPIVDARCEAIDKLHGKHASFHDYYLPEAVIRFRQGFGRLIRMRTDRGVVIVTDPRLVTKSYGTTFRRSIPTSVHTVTSLDELLSRTTTFLEDNLP